MKLMGNPEAAAAGIAERLPGILARLMDKCSEACGQPAGQAVGVLFFHADTPQGQRLLARVHRLDAFGELGDDLGTVDVGTVLAGMQASEIMGMLQ